MIDFEENMVYEAVPVSIVKQINLSQKHVPLVVSYTNPHDSREIIVQLKLDNVYITTIRILLLNLFNLICYLFFKDQKIQEFLKSNLHM